jgi:two-component system invasion response regulator UvrY
MIRLAIVDDHAIVRTGLRQYFSELGDIEVVAEATNGRDAQALVRNGGIDVLLMDISMPDQNGVDVLRNIRAHTPDMPVLILSSFPEEHYAVSVLRQGASGYLNKMCEPEEIATAIRTVAAGKRYVSTAVAGMLAGQLNRDTDKPPHELLSERELQVFLRLAKGETVGAIADSLALSIKTVSTYRARILEKLALSSNSDITYYALKNGLIQ